MVVVVNELSVRTHHEFAADDGKTKQNLCLTEFYNLKYVFVSTHTGLFRKWPAFRTITYTADSPIVTVKSLIEPFLSW